MIICLEFASVLKALGRVRGALLIEKTTTSTRVKSQFALKVDFIERKTLDIAKDLCDFHKLLVCRLNLIYHVNCQLQEQETDSSPVAPSTPAHGNFEHC